MKLYKPTLANRLAKRFARPLSRIACSPLLYKPSRLADIYLNALMGKGAGTGWDMSGEVDAALARIHREKPLVFDLGANMGSWTSSLLKARPGATAFMFDPSPGCQEHIRGLELPNAILIPCGVGEKPGTATFHYSEEIDGSASLYERRDTPFQEKIYKTREVNITTIDRVVEEHGIAFIDFMKMDIEGHELFALRGGAKTFAARKIGGLSFEFGCPNINSRTFFKDFWDLLTGAGFSLARITPGGRSVVIEDYYEDLEFFRGATNYVAELKDHPYRK